MPIGKTFAALALAFPLVSCSSQKTISQEELRSKVTMAASLAAESEAFLDFSAQGRSTANYARGHTQYLADSASRLARELDEPAAARNLERLRQSCRDELPQLAQALQKATLMAPQSEQLRQTRQLVAAIHSRLEQLKAGL